MGNINLLGSDRFPCQKLDVQQFQLPPLVIDDYVRRLAYRCPINRTRIVVVLVLIFQRRERQRPLAHVLAVDVAL